MDTFATREEEAPTVRQPLFPTLTAEEARMTPEEMAIVFGTGQEETAFVYETAPEAGQTLRLEVVTSRPEEAGEAQPEEEEDDV